MYDRRMRELERAHQQDPADVEVQHAYLAALVRVGELPPAALDRLHPGRPVMPWQWKRLSYTLLEAEELGRRTEWREGKVAIYWDWDKIPGDLPVWGLDAQPLVEAGVRPSGTRPFSSVPRPWHPPDLGMIVTHRREKFAARPVFVGTKQAGYEVSQIIAGLDPDDYTPPQSSPEWLDFFPARWIPGVTALEAEVIERRRGLFQHIFATGTLDPGGYPDAYEPQMLLFASPRVIKARPGRWAPAPRRAQRDLYSEGPLLDVRMILDVIPLRRHGRVWVADRS